MSAFKTHKRKSSIKTEPESPKAKNIKVEKLSPTPKQTAKYKKFPKHENQKTPGTETKTFNQIVPKQENTPKPKLEKFKGTSKLDFKTSPKHVTKTEPGESVSPKKNRHQLKRIKNKDKRREARAKFLQLKTLAIQGDEAARKEVKTKIDVIESSGAALSKNKKKQLATLKRIFNKDNQKDNKVAIKSNTKKVNQAPQKPVVQKQVIQKQATNQKPSKQLNGKQAQIKPVKQENDSEDDDDDEENIFEEDEEGASDDEVNEESAEEDEDGSDEEAEESEDDEGSEEEDDDDSDAESDEEQANNKNKNINKKVIPQQTGKQENKQKNNPGKPVVPQSTPSPANKSRYVVFVGNIAYSSTKDDLQEHFKKSGDIADIRIPTNPDGKPKGFAYVELKDETAYQKALSLHNTFLGGRKINVLYTQGGKKNSNKQKGEIKAKNFKLQAMRKQGHFQGGNKANQNRFQRRAKNAK